MTRKREINGSQACKMLWAAFSMIENCDIDKRGYYVKDFHRLCDSLGVSRDIRKCDIYHCTFVFDLSVWVVK